MENDRYTIEDLLALTRKNWRAADTRGHEFAITLGRLAVSAGMVIAHLAGERGLTQAEFDVLATLRKAAPPFELTPTELQKAVVITSGGLTKVLYQLEARKLIGRSIDAADRRSKRVRLTRAGRTAIEGAMKNVLAAHERWLAALSARERMQLTGLLRKVLQEVALDQAAARTGRH